MMLDESSNFIYFTELEYTVFRRTSDETSDISLKSQIGMILALSWRKAQLRYHLETGGSKVKNKKII